MHSREQALAIREGSVVTWTTNGKEKSGVILRWVPPGVLTRKSQLDHLGTLKFGREATDYPRYLILVGRRHPAAKPRVYCPSAGMIESANPQAPKERVGTSVWKESRYGATRG